MLPAGRRTAHATYAREGTRKTHPLSLSLHLSTCMALQDLGHGTVSSPQCMLKRQPKMHPAFEQSQQKIWFSQILPDKIAAKS